MTREAIAETSIDTIHKWLDKCILNKSTHRAQGETVVNGKIIPKWFFFSIKLIRCEKSTRIDLLPTVPEKDEPMRIPLAAVKAFAETMQQDIALPPDTEISIWQHYINGYCIKLTVAE